MVALPSRAETVGSRVVDIVFASFPVYRREPRSFAYVLLDGPVPPCVFARLGYVMTVPGPFADVEIPMEAVGIERLSDGSTELKLELKPQESDDGRYAIAFQTLVDEAFSRNRHYWEEIASVRMIDPADPRRSAVVENGSFQEQKPVALADVFRSLPADEDDIPIYVDEGGRCVRAELIDMDFGNF